MTSLIWRQHRGQALWTVITVTALCLLAVSFGLSAEQRLTGYHSWLGQLAAAGCPPPNAHSGSFHVNSPETCLALKNRYPGSQQAAFVSRYGNAILMSQYGLPAVVAITGALIGAPLVAREVEQRTHLAAWTQSVSRFRWYAAKTSALAACLAVAGLIAGTVNAWLQHQLTAGDTASSRPAGRNPRRTSCSGPPRFSERQVHVVFLAEKERLGRAAGAAAVEEHPPDAGTTRLSWQMSSG